MLKRLYRSLRRWQNCAACCLLPLLVLAACAATDGAEDDGRLEYAQWLRMKEGAGYTLCSIMDPWNEGKVMQRLVLTEEANPAADSIEGLHIRVPLQRAVCGATPHAHLAFRLGSGGRIAGLLDADYAVSDSLRRAIASGLLTDCGGAMNPDIERLAALRPDALLLSPFAGSGYGVLENRGVPIIACADYMETSPLGRAEWMRLYGRLFGCRAEADSLFAAETARYVSLQREAATTAMATRPSLIVDRMQGEAWYVPGAESYLGRLFEDAGFRYVFQKYRQAGSVALTLDEAYALGREADCWLLRTASSLSAAELRRADPRYGEFRPLQTGNVWQCNTLTTPYYDILPFAPSELLRELISIARQGQRATADSLQYFERLH